MLFSSPVFTPSYYVTEPDSFDYGLTLINDLGPDTSAGKSIFEHTIKKQT